jgi:hypothetical protein
MIDIFVRTNTPIADVQAALSGFNCNRVMVRNGGPTEVWQRIEDGWRKDQPGLYLYEDLVSTYVDFHACRYERSSMLSDLVIDGMTLHLDSVEAEEWLAAMEKHRYALEDAIGCSVNVEHGAKMIVCAAPLFAVSAFKKFLEPDTTVGRKLLGWVDRILSAGADQVGAAIAIRQACNAGV